MSQRETSISEDGQVVPPATPGSLNTSSASSISRPLLIRIFFGALGLLCTALGTIGYFVPVMPGTVFLIIALWAFRKSSARLERWLLSIKFVGPVLRAWDEERSMTLRAKIIAISVIWISIGGSCLYINRKFDLTRATASANSLAHKIPKAVPIGVLLLVASILTWYLATRKTKAV